MALLSIAVQSPSQVGGSTPVGVTNIAFVGTAPGPEGPTGPTGANGVPGVGANWRGIYSSGTTYASGDGVTASNGLQYISNVSGNVGNDPTTDGGVNWAPLGPLSASILNTGGASGIPAWQAIHAYVPNQVVTNNGGVFLGAAAHTSGASFPGIGTDWQALSPASAMYPLGTDDFYNLAIGTNFPSIIPGLVGTSAGGNTFVTSGGTGASGLGGPGTSLTTGWSNTCVGFQAGTTVDVGIRNTAVGAVCLGSGSGTTMSGNGNVAVGEGSLYRMISGSSNVGIGINAAQFLTSGNNNVALGGNAMGLGVVTGSGSVGVGFEALQNLTSGSGHVAVGNLAGNAITTGNNLTAVGFGAAQNTTAIHVTAIGYNALNSNTTGINTALGYQAGLSLLGGSLNVLMGENAGQSLTSGGSNVMIGRSAGQAPAGVTANASVTGSSNTFVGHQTGPSGTADSTGMTLLGFQALGGGNNAIAIGNAANAGGNQSIAIGKGTSAGAAGAVAIGTDSTNVGASTSTSNVIALGTANHTVSIAGLLKVTGNVGFFGKSNVAQQTMGVATAAATYSTNEQTMLQAVYNAVRAFGFGT